VSIAWSTNDKIGYSISIYITGCGNRLAEIVKVRSSIFLKKKRSIGTGVNESPATIAQSIVCLRSTNDKI
ncbi:MAG: hypothetical protein ACRECJ_03665, partial [Limisphaerales bacterium]